jgi:hypothetical protein
LLVLLSGGLFGFAWLLLMLRHANLAVGKHGDAVLSAIFLGFLALYLVMYAAMMGHGYPVPAILLVPTIALALTLTGMWISFVVIITNRIRSASGLAPSVTEAIVMLVLSILVFISLPILQRRLNKIARARQQPAEQSGISQRGPGPKRPDR